MDEWKLPRRSLPPFTLTLLCFWRHTLRLPVYTFLQCYNVWLKLQLLFPPKKRGINWKIFLETCLFITRVILIWMPHCSLSSLPHVTQNCRKISAIMLWHLAAILWKKVVLIWRRKKHIDKWLSKYSLDRCRKYCRAMCRQD